MGDSLSHLDDLLPAAVHQIWKLRHIESMTSKVQPTKNYGTDYVKMTPKVQPAADY